MTKTQNHMIGKGLMNENEKGKGIIRSRKLMRIQKCKDKQDHAAGQQRWNGIYAEILVWRK